MTELIRIALRAGPATAAEIQRRMGLKNLNIHPYLKQMQRSKSQPVVKIDGRYALKHEYTALQEWR